ncbi:MAG: hypothetical protein AB1429_10195 [Pseudomonadota bacterium]|jgi:hypothetical protein
MKHPVRRFRSLELALKELEPFIRDGRHLQAGKPFARFGDLRSREILGNWLLCVAMAAAGEGDFYFTTDPTGGDGIICEADSEATWPTEHVMVPELGDSDAPSVEDRVLAQIRLKVEKGGAAYATGKTLLVFLNAAGGAWHPNRVARLLPSPLHFDTAWAMGLQEVIDGAYVYGVTNLNVAGGNAPTWRVSVAPDFKSWTVERVQ